MTGRFMCMALCVMGCIGMVCGTARGRHNLAFAGSLLQVIGAFGDLVLTHG